MVQINVASVMSVIQKGLQVCNFDFAQLTKFREEVSTVFFGLQGALKIL